MLHIRVIDGLASLLKFVLKFKWLRFLASVFLVLFLAGKILVSWTEFPFKMAEWFAVKADLKKTDVILVLSGGADQDRKVLEGVTLAREIYGIQLWRQGCAPKILFSGGQVSEKYLHDSLYMKELAVNLGVPAEAILVENESRNTLENIRSSKKVMEENGLRTALLVTSPLHMRRSLFFADKFGLKAYPAPSPFWVQAKQGPEIMAQIKIELIGMTVYKFFHEETVRKAALFVRESFLFNLL